MISPIEELEDGESLWRCPECGQIAKLSYDIPVGISRKSLLALLTCRDCGVEMELQD